MDIVAVARGPSQGLITPVPLPPGPVHSDYRRRSLATTNAAESLISRTRMVKRHVKRWRGGQMMLRWVAAGILEAAKGFRRLKGYADMPTLVTALRTRDRQVGLVAAQENRQVA